ncbi:sulfurtransferase [Lentimicrobium sp. L6]|uniref:sulfurtransferase n=1 Tax=Lentimicrobium sp. L6 TaxID=2735916 RepID=UPI001557EA43|nr:rhodanese-like domain-containing protein [Lentimicrobium sp. L6]NPD84984.1 sulfurtransferase [Lentimicrobium sp. L6]
MKQIFKNITIVIAFLFVLPTVFAQLDIINAAEYKALVKSDKNVVTVHAGKAKNYNANHLKGSILISYKDTDQKGDIKGLMMSPQDLAKFFGESGISETNTIVLYDNGSQKYSTRMYWLLKYLGAPNVKILHKDKDEWRKARLVLVSTPTKGKATTFTPSVDASILALMADVEASKDDANMVLIDVRAANEFDGTEEKSNGHIPGAININHKDFLTESEAFKSADELKALVEKAGATSDKTIILYCTTSIRGAVGYVAFKNILEYPNVKLYDGAEQEWITKHKLEK